MPLALALAAIAGRTIVALARHATRLVLAWLALRGSRPEQRPEILRAMMSANTLVPDGRQTAPSARPCLSLRCEDRTRHHRDAAR